MSAPSPNLARVVVIGTSCSGKTTFAGNLARILQVPHTEMDALHWRPNWTPAPHEELKAAVLEVVAPDAWVLDGNYGKLGNIMWGRATTIIWLDYPFPVVFGRALRRTVRRSWYREELWAGNRESWRLSFFSKDSILWWVITTYRKRRREIPRRFEKPENRHLQFVVLNSPKQAAAFLRGVQSRG